MLNQKGNQMLAENHASHNAHVNDNGRIIYAPCPSDYPAIDVTPRPTSKPGWRNEYSIFTETVQWLDPDGVSHSLTIRSDSLHT